MLYCRSGAGHATKECYVCHVIDSICIDVVALNVAQMMGRVNKERLGQYLGGIQRKENTEDRFSAALRGETLAGPPDARVIAGAATISMPAASLHPENIAVPLQTGPSPEQSKVAATTTSFTTP